MPTSVVNSVDLDPTTTARLEALASERAAMLGREALTDQARRALSGGASALVILEETDGEISTCGVATPGDGMLDLELLGDEVHGPVLDAAGSLAEDRHESLRIWLHGVTEEPVAPHDGLVIVRRLLRLERALPALPPGPLLEGLEVRAFQVESDEEAWVAVNARSFAEHPDQGATTLADLLELERAPWFDAEGFLVAWRDAELAGFCWTKVHEHTWERAGEIYVIGVDPSAAGIGLGRLLLRLGLEHLAEIGLNKAMLYVEADNAPALSLYAREGFTVAWSDVLWGTPAPVR